MNIKEVLVYAVVAASSLFISAYTVHMLVGGLISAESEYMWMSVICSAVALVVAFMAWDVIRRRG
jgi:hypothetical protein